MVSYTISEPCALNRDFRQWTDEESALCPIVTRIRQILRDVGAEINIKILHRLEKYVCKKSSPNITLLQFLRQILRFGGGSKAS